MTNSSKLADETADLDPLKARPLGSDLLRGADEIAGFMFGDPAERRKIYHLAENSRLPVFRLGALLCARKSTLLTWIEEQESAATARQT